MIAPGGTGGPRPGGVDGVGKAAAVVAAVAPRGSGVAWELEEGNILFADADADDAATRGIADVSGCKSAKRKMRWGSRSVLVLGLGHIPVVSLGRNLHLEVIILLRWDGVVC